MQGSTLDRRHTSKDLKRLYNRRYRTVEAMHASIEEGSRVREMQDALRDDEAFMRLKDKFSREEHTRSLREQELEAAQEEERQREDARVQLALARHRMQALMKASVEGDWKVVRHWLQEGASTTCKEAEFGYTPLHFAASQGHDAIVEVLMQHDAPMEAKTFFGHTPLALAVLHCRTETTELLLKRGADPFAEDNNMESVFDLALNCPAVVNTAHLETNIIKLLKVHALSQAAALSPDREGQTQALAVELQLTTPGDGVLDLDARMLGSSKNRWPDGVNYGSKEGTA